MYFNKETVNLNTARIIRFTPILCEWLLQVKEREQWFWNQVVLQCCKNCMAKDNNDGKVGGREVYPADGMQRGGN